MKKPFTLFLFFLLTGSLLFPRQVSAQAPDKMSYQAVIRDTEGNLVTEQEIGMQISILQGSADGTVVYTETQTPLTNKNGLVSIEIGGEAGFADIDWSAGPYFIKTETDPSGGTDYTITGTSQLLSVPYALHSGTSDVLAGEITESQISDLQDYLTGETDPLFTGSPASGIEADDIDNWDDAYLWGDHAVEDYLTEESQGLTDVIAIDNSANNQNITNLADPVNDMDAANKAYVDDILAAFGISLPDNYAGTVNDIDGNTYRTITIGTQTWMAENLRTGRYNDNTEIPFVTDINEWEGLLTPGYCWYENELTHNTTYGALYNWHAVNTEKLCPTGWHVPSDDEWTVLTDYLEEITAGGKLKETGTSHWKSPNTGATNETGFSALPGGIRNFQGYFLYIGIYGCWWSSTRESKSDAWYGNMKHERSDVQLNTYPKKGGFSVRCLKD